MSVWYAGTHVQSSEVAMTQKGRSLLPSLRCTQVATKEANYLDGKEGTAGWLSDEIHHLWHRVLHETDYEPCLDALPFGARETLTPEHKFV